MSGAMMPLAGMPGYEPFGPLMEEAAAQYGLDPEMFKRHLWQESRWNPKAVSPAGAQGIAQFMPATATEWNLNPIGDPEGSIFKSAAYLADLRDQFGGDMRNAYAAYNAGPEAVKKYGGVPPFEETQNHVNTVVGPQPPMQDAGGMPMLDAMRPPIQQAQNAASPPPMMNAPGDLGMEMPASAPSTLESAFQGRKLAPGEITPEQFNAGVPKTGFMANLTSPAGAAGALGALATTDFEDPASIGASAGSIAGSALGSSIGALGALGGPVGAVAGSFLGSELGGLFGGDDEEEEAKKKREQQTMIALFEANQRAKMQQMGVTQNNLDAITQYLQRGR